MRTTFHNLKLVHKFKNKTKANDDTNVSYHYFVVGGQHMCMYTMCVCVCVCVTCARTLNIKTKQHQCFHTNVNCEEVRNMTLREGIKFSKLLRIT